jgi:hypothetical protein
VNSVINRASGRGAGPENPELRELLASFCGARIHALLNPGNRGDGLIHLGGRQLFAEAGIKWTEISVHDAPPETDVLLVFANGAFSRFGHFFMRFAASAAERAKRIVLLPGTFEVECPKVSAYLRGLDERHTVFCREKRSFASLRGLRSDWGKRLVLGHDLALHCDLSAWSARPAEGVIGIFRADGEFTSSAKPAGMPRIDASAGPAWEVDALLDIVAAHKVIHTDRCHAAVSGALMGREVHMYPNGYYKNAAIHEHSLAGFPNLTMEAPGRFSPVEFVRGTWSTLSHRWYHRLRYLADRIRR